MGTSALRKSTDLSFFVIYLKSLLTCPWALDFFHRVWMRHEHQLNFTRLNLVPKRCTGLHECNVRLQREHPASSRIKTSVFYREGDIINCLLCFKCNLLGSFLHLLFLFASLLWVALNWTHFYYYLLGQMGFAHLECEVSDFFLKVVLSHIYS